VLAGTCRARHPAASSATTRHTCAGCIPALLEPIGLANPVFIATRSSVRRLMSWYGIVIEHVVTWRRITWHSAVAAGDILSRAWSYPVLRFSHHPAASRIGWVFFFNERIGLTRVCIAQSSSTKHYFRLVQISSRGILTRPSSSHTLGSTNVAHATLFALYKDASNDDRNSNI
jgi:hypothetical protein